MFVYEYILQYYSNVSSCNIIFFVISIHSHINKNKNSINIKLKTVWKSTV